MKFSKQSTCFAVGGFFHTFIKLCSFRNLKQIIGHLTKFNAVKIESNFLNYFHLSGPFLFIILTAGPVRPGTKLALF